MAAIQRDQLRRLCSSSETFQKADSILRLANAKTRPGSGFVVKNTVAIPAICAYLASEQLNTDEVSLQSAMAAACVSKVEFSDILKKVRAALGAEEMNTVTSLTYETLANAYHVRSKEHAIACMEDTQAALPNVGLLKERYGASVVLGAVFYWVCQLMEEPSVQERSLRHAYSIDPKPFKAVVAILDKRCDAVAEQIKSHFKSPIKPSTGQHTMPGKTSTPATGTSRKRIGDRAPFPETPTKKRRVDSSSPVKPGTSTSPAKHSSTLAIAAFHAALKGSPTKPPAEQETELPVAGPSTPRHPRHAEKAGAMAFLPQTQPTTRRRFRPVFLEQQQWCARDPKVERMWAVAQSLREEMVESHGHPFQQLCAR